MKKSELYRMLCFASSIMIGVGAFAPFTGLSAFDPDLGRTLMQSIDGYIVVAIAACGFYLSKKDNFGASASIGLLSFVVWIYEVQRFEVHLGYQSGYYALILGSIGLAVFSYLANIELRREESKDKKNNGTLQNT